jgi:hypothetical protein
MMTGHNTHHPKSNQPISDTIVSSLSPESTQQAITGDLRLRSEWTDPYQEESNAINDRLLVAEIVIGLVVGIIVVAVRNPPCTAAEIHESSTPLLKILN